MKDGGLSLLTQLMMTEEYIRDVKEAAKQLGHGDDAMVNLLKATMPTELYGTLYSHNNLPLLCTMLKDIYATKPQHTATTTATTTPGATGPIHSFKNSCQDSTQAHRRPFPGRKG